jgi:hypothetical protein
MKGPGRCGGRPGAFRISDGSAVSLNYCPLVLDLYDGTGALIQAGTIELAPDELLTPVSS